MNILYFDCFSGISGDMNLGAMIDLGVSPDALISGLQKLKISGWRLEINKDQRHGISGTRVTVITDEGSVSSHENDHDHLHSHDHHHSHGSDHHHSHDHSHLKADKINRNLSDIELIISDSALPENVRTLSKEIFKRIAEAEAAVHNKPLNEIRFHEVGAIDSIIDIVGSAICFTLLGVEKVYVNTVELGGGMVRCEHGLLPVPAPATSTILRGFPVHLGGVDFEATTPTGAAIIAALATPAPEGLTFSIKSTGYGIGQKKNPSRPNVLRLFLAEATEDSRSGHQAVVVECNVDDMNPELSEYVSQRLFDAGARDVFFTPVMMKKGRPAFTISVICEEEQVTRIREILFSESTTIGLRIFHFTKETLHREFEEIETRFGKVVIKKSFFNGRLVSAKPEADRCAAIAAETGIPMKQVINEIISLITK